MAPEAEFSLGGKLGDIERHLVPVVAFLAGAGSGFLTGQVYAVDGGQLLMGSPAAVAGRDDDYTSWRRRTLPAALRGSAVISSITPGTLNGASRARAWARSSSVDGGALGSFATITAFTVSP